MSPETKAVLGGLVIVGVFSLSVAINEFGIWWAIRRPRARKPVLFDWENDVELPLALEPELFDPITDAQLEAMAFAHALAQPETSPLIRDLMRQERRAHTALYAVPDPNVIRLPVTNDARLSPGA